MDMTTFLAGLLVGLVLGLLVAGGMRYRAARKAGLSFPQALMSVVNGGGGPPKDP